MNAPLIVAGSLAILGAAIHGVGGDVLVMRKLSPGMLPTSRFGGPGMTKTMIHITWHMTTIAFRTVGSAQPPMSRRPTSRPPPSTAFRSGRRSPAAGAESSISVVCRRTGRQRLGL